MNKIFTLLCLGFALWSCHQEPTFDVDPDGVGAGPGDVVVSFANEPSISVSPFSRATLAKDFEMKLHQVTLVLVRREAGTSASPNDKVAMIYPFAPLQIEKGRAIFPLSTDPTNGLRDKEGTVTFYAVVNQAIYPALTEGVSTRGQVEAMIERNAEATADADIAQYNGTHAEVSSAAQRQGGFVMSSFVPFEVALDPNALTPVKAEIALRRTVAKVEINSATSATFAANYPGAALRVDRIEVVNSSWRKGANLFVINNNDAPTSAALSQNTVAGQNLFYLFEQQKAFEVHLYATFALNGDFSDNTAGNVILVGPYQLTAASGKALQGEASAPYFLRNKYYVFSIQIHGLSPNEVASTLKIEDWQAVVPQSIEIGG